MPGGADRCIWPVTETNWIALVLTLCVDPISLALSSEDRIRRRMRFNAIGRPRRKTLTISLFAVTCYQQLSQSPNLLNQRKLDDRLSCLVLQGEAFANSATRAANCGADQCQAV